MIMFKYTICVMNVVKKNKVYKKNFHPASCLSNLSLSKASKASKAWKAREAENNNNNGELRFCGVGPRMAPPCPVVAAAAVRR